MENSKQVKALPNLEVGDRVFLLYRNNEGAIIKEAGTVSVVDRTPSDELVWGIYYDTDYIHDLNWGNTTHKRPGWLRQTQIEEGICNIIPEKIGYIPRLGDRVVAREPGCFYRVGEKGTVVAVGELETGGYSFGIMFDEYHYNRHTCDGLCKKGYGYWASINKILNGSLEITLKKKKNNLLT